MSRWTRRRAARLRLLPEPEVVRSKIQKGASLPRLPRKRYFAQYNKPVSHPRALRVPVLSNQQFKHDYFGTRSHLDAFTNSSVPNYRWTCSHAHGDSSCTAHAANSGIADCQQSTAKQHFPLCVDTPTHIAAVCFDAVELLRVAAAVPSSASTPGGTSPAQRLRLRPRDLVGNELQGATFTTNADAGAVILTSARARLPARAG